jgi:hypothetical protein
VNRRAAIGTVSHAVPNSIAQDESNKPRSRPVVAERLRLRTTFSAREQQDRA